MKQIVGAADMIVSSRPGDLLIARGIGNSLGIAVHDAQACVGGLLHVLLPSAAVYPDGASLSPAMFVDTGLPQLLDECCAAGALRDRMIVAVAGAACTESGEASEQEFNLGRRTLAALRGLLWRGGLTIQYSEVGGTLSRTLSLEVGTGAVVIAVDPVSVAARDAGPLYPLPASPATEAQLHVAALPGAGR